MHTHACTHTWVVNILGLKVVSLLSVAAAWASCSVFGNEKKPGSIMHGLCGQGGGGFPCAKTINHSFAYAGPLLCVRLFQLCPKVWQASAEYVTWNHPRDGERGREEGRKEEMSMQQYEPALSIHAGYSTAISTVTYQTAFLSLQHVLYTYIHAYFSHTCQ